MIRAVRAAFVFLTRIPVGGFPYVANEWAWAPAHFPLVGAVVGGLAGLVDRALLPAGGLAAAILALAFSMLLTGAFHEDGLADTSDALGGAYDREKVLSILKDSRVGSFGAAALVVSIAGRAALLAELGLRAPVALIIASGGARLAPVWMMALLPYAQDRAEVKSRHLTGVRIPQALVASTWVAVTLGASAAAIDLSFARIAVLVTIWALVGLVTSWRYVRRVGGLTGDFLGATEQIGELAALAVLAYRV
jgi:adenosylcobinamide-GDP ribazoletransferase